jgi:hypothetical protein
MTDTADHDKLASYGGYNPPRRNAIMKGVGPLRRFFHALYNSMHESRRRQAEREIAKFAAGRHERITNEFREIRREPIYSVNLRRSTFG